MTRTSTPTVLCDIMAQRFPLVPHAKPPCRPLADRVARVRELARRAGQHPEQTLVHAGEACNLAALIVSDCAMPDLARTLCRQQFEIFYARRPHDAPTANSHSNP